MVHLHQGFWQWAGLGHQWGSGWDLWWEPCLCLAVDLQGLGQCVVWWAWDPVGFPQEGPLLLLQPVLAVYPRTYLYLVYLPLAAARHLPALTGGPLRCLPLGHL